MTLATVALINLGQQKLPVDLTTLADKLNSCQTSFHFAVAQPIPISELGDPDFELQWYDVERLF